jgi:Protein of unknown function (DUF1592)/Protein of unknown function (DUF1588)/Protein of unknown function (DUF1595)/Protein of unknown function (DUF1587)/Protein of unknown function (DUF1585)
MRAHWSFGAALIAAGSAAAACSAPDDEPLPPILDHPTDNAGDGGAGSAAPGSGGAANVFATDLPRLTHDQWENTVQDLLRLPAPTGLSKTLTRDPQQTIFPDLHALVTPPLWQDYQRVSEAVAKQVTSDPTALARVLPKNLPADAPSRARAFVTDFGRRAFRRPLTSDEIASYADGFARGTELTGTADPIAAGVQITIQSMLQSAAFLYRSELGTAKGATSHLSSYEVASMLSYSIWNTMPDDALMTLADQNALLDPGALATQAGAMLDDARGQKTLVGFHKTLFHADEYANIVKGTTSHPEFTADVPGLLVQEAELFFADVMKNGGTARDLLTAPYTFANDKTGTFYGLTLAGSDMRRVDLDPAERAGFLTHAGFLARYGHDVEPDSIHRGVLINVGLMCTTLTAPQNVNVQPPGDAGPGQTNRDLITKITAPCGGSCHADKINPMGFAFEHYDGVGRWRTQDNGAPVDSTGSYAFEGGAKSYAGAVELSKAIAESAEFHRCYGRRWVEFTLGKTPADGDPLLDDLTRASLAGASVKALAVKLLSNPSLLERQVLP